MLRCLLLLSIHLFTLTLNAQGLSVQGTVKDKLSKEALVGASISLKNTFDGATTDVSGAFKFNTEEKGVQSLLVAYLGYKTQEIQVDMGALPTTFDIYLEEIPTEIGEVVISAGAFEASDEKKGVVLLPIDIVTVPGANGDITGALNTLPGTSVNGESGQLIVRGGAAYETRIYIDGLATRNFYSTGAQDVPVRSRFSPFQFKGTTFSSGGYSAEYGQALSAALILNTPDMPTEGGKSVNLSMLGFGGGYTKLNTNSAWTINGNYTNLAPYMGIIKQRLDFFKAPESGNLAAEGRIKTKNGGIIKMGAQGTLNRVGMRYPKLPFEATSFETKINNQNARGFAVWRQPVGTTLTLFTAVQGEFNNDDFKFGETFDFTQQVRAISGRFTATYSPSRRFRLKSGAEYNFLQLRNSLAPAYLNHTVGAVFTEAETYAGDRLVVRAGLRGEHDALLERSNLAPRLSAAWKTGKNSQLSASWGLFYQSPEDTLLLRYQNLGFERAQHYILNYQISKQGFIFRTEVFHKQYDHLVRTLGAWDNQGDGYARGVELFFRDRKTFRWGDYWLSYSWLDTRRQFRWYPSSAMPLFAASHNASVVYKYYFSKPQISANMSYTFQTGRPYYNPGSETFLSDRTPEYHNLSMQIAKLASIKGNFTIFVLSVTNILGSKQVFNYRFTQIPDSNPTAYHRQEILPIAPRFIFLGCFINIGDKRKKVSKEEALE